MSRLHVQYNKNQRSVPQTFGRAFSNRPLDVRALCRNTPLFSLPSVLELTVRRDSDMEKEP